MIERIFRRLGGRPKKGICHAKGKFRLKEYRYGSTPVQAVFRAGTMDEAIFANIYEEYGIASLVRSLAGRRATVVDIGGHIGGFSVILASLLPELEAHLYEYVPENCRMIQVNIFLNGLERRVCVFNRVVGDRNDGFVRSISFSEADTNTGGVCIAYPSDVSAEADGTAVPTIASKDLIAAVDRVDVLKIDCEASEYKILFSLDEEDYRKIGLITGEIHDGRHFYGFETNGHSWKAGELLDYLRRFYRTVTVHKTNTVDWGFMQIFTAADPRADTGGRPL
ncbi:MAG: FkbM family methyltransferase [Thermoguttaceae bacterium]|jgi:FkbM family methyltransferase